MKQIIVLLLTGIICAAGAQDKYQGRSITAEQFEALYREAAHSLRVYNGKIYSVGDDGAFEALKATAQVGEAGVVTMQIQETSDRFALVKLFFNKNLNDEISGGTVKDTNPESVSDGVIVNNRRDFWAGHSSREILVRINAPKGRPPFRSACYYALTIPPTKEEFRRYINGGGVLKHAAEAGTEKKGAVELDAEISPVDKPPALDKKSQGEVVGVLDGATLLLTHPGGSLDMHLYGVKAPEVNAEYGKDSRRALSHLVIGKKVTVAYYTVDGKNYGDVFIGKQYINEELLRGGHAWHNTAQPSAALKQAEISAQEAKKGWWAYHEKNMEDD